MIGLRRRVSGAPDCSIDNERIGAERGGVERAFRQRRLRQSEIDLAADERRQQRDGRRVLVQRHRRAVDAQQRRDETGEQVGRRADSQRGVAVPVERREIGLGGTHARDHRVGVREHDLAGIGQRERPRSARAVDQALPRQVLECRDLMADRRLHVPEARRSTAERPLTRNRVQRHEVSQLHSRPPFACHFRGVTTVTIMKP